MTKQRVLLHLDEAVELGHAWIQALGAENGIRLLLIKGPTLHRQGLRDERSSADIDVLVEPARFADLCAAVLEAGWTERPRIFMGRGTTLHAMTFINEGWPCDLDVHSFYSGFLSDPALVFDALWARHVQMQFAHRPCDVPDRVAAMLILALHSLRGTTLQRRHADELEQLVRAELADEERADATALALVTGSAATLQDVLPRLGVEVQPSTAELESDALREWRARIAAGSHGTYFWLLALRKAQPRERPMMLWRAFWPSGTQLRIVHPDIDGTSLSALRVRWRRWMSGFTSAPAAFRAAYAYRRRG